MCQVSTCTWCDCPFVKFPHYELIQSSNISSTTGSNSCSNSGRLYLPSCLGQVFSQPSSTSCCFTQSISKLAFSLGFFKSAIPVANSCRHNRKVGTKKVGTTAWPTSCCCSCKHHTHTHTTHNDVQLHMWKFCVCESSVCANCVPDILYVYECVQSILQGSCNWHPSPHPSHNSKSCLNLQYDNFSLCSSHVSKLLTISYFNIMNQNKINGFSKYWTTLIVSR